MRQLLWVARVAGFAVVGLLALLGTPRGPLARPMLIAGFSLLALGLVAWALIDLHPAGARYRERWLPVALGLIAVAAGFSSTIGGNSDSAVSYAIVATVAAGSEISLPAGLAVSAAGILAIEVGAVVYGEGFGTLAGFPLLLLLGLLTGRNRSAYRIQAEQSAALLAQYERLQAEQRRADVLDERTRIAREIHDVLAHSLGALGIQIQAARAVLEDQKDIDHAVEMLTAAQRMASEGLVETRRAVHALRVDMLPLSEELTRTVDTYRQRYRVAAGFKTSGVPRPLPPEANLALLRIAQEALINAAKHAEGRPAAVRLDYGDQEVRLTVVNDLLPGRAAGPAVEGARTGPTGGVNGGYGLTGMHERLRLLNGTLTAGPQNDQWAVTALLPLPPGPRPEDAVR
ncbi:sensor histidine kinase [Streptacidiphilus sp. PAMC 29251]